MHIRIRIRILAFQFILINKSNYHKLFVTHKPEACNGLGRWDSGPLCLVSNPALSYSECFPCGEKLFLTGTTGLDR